MSNRVKHHWQVHLQRSDGEMIVYDLHSYWDPSQEETKEAVERAAAAQAHVESKKQYQFAPVASELVVEQKAPALS